MATQATDQQGQHGWRSASVRRFELKRIGSVVEELQTGRLSRSIGQAHGCQACRTDGNDVGRFKSEKPLQDRANDAAMANDEKVLARVFFLRRDHGLNTAREIIPGLAARRRLPAGAPAQISVRIAGFDVFNGAAGPFSDIDLPQLFGEDRITRADALGRVTDTLKIGRNRTAWFDRLDNGAQRVGLMATVVGQADIGLALKTVRWS